jgi:dihydropyrimidinase
VAVEGERIVALGLARARAAGRTGDRRHRQDRRARRHRAPHAPGARHLDAAEENLSTLGPEEDTRGMVFGGTTTHVDFCFVRPGTDVQQVIETRAARWKGNSYADYSFHVTLQGVLPIKLFDQLPEAVQAGFPSFKVFTVDVLPPHPKRHPYRLDYGRIQLAMEKIAPHNGIMVVHAEDHDIVQFMYEKFREEKQTDGWLLPLVHNKLSEKLAFPTYDPARRPHRGRRLLRPHVGRGGRRGRSRRRAPAAIRSTRRRLHHYACFTAEDYKSPRGFCYHTYPSLKYPEGPGRRSGTGSCATASRRRRPTSSRRRST